MRVRVLREVEQGRWALLVEDRAPPEDWCPLREQGCPGECLGDECPAARQPSGPASTGPADDNCEHELLDRKGMR